MYFILKQFSETVLVLFGLFDEMFAESKLASYLDSLAPSIRNTVIVNTADHYNHLLRKGL